MADDVYSGQEAAARQGLRHMVCLELQFGFVSSMKIGWLEWVQFDRGFPHRAHPVLVSPDGSCHMKRPVL